MAWRNWRISRRTALRGLGASVGLPLLDAMAPRSRAAGGDEAPSGPAGRLAVLYMPNGVLLPAWTPKGEGRDWELSPILEPLAKVKDQCLVISDLRNTAGLAGDGHYAKTASWLTGARAVRTGGKDIRAGISFDQLAAKAVGDQTALPSLELGIDPVHTVVDMGYSTVYGCHVSWPTPNLPAVKETQPRAAFDRLFRAADPRRLADSRSVLDLVGDEAKGLRRRIGGADRGKLDEYLDAVRAVEKRLERLDHRASNGRELGAVMTRPERDPADFAEHVRLMLDILVLAFWTDSTRVVSFMFGNDVSGRDFSFLDGVREGFHPVSHHESNATKQEQYQKINRWHIAQVAYLLERLDSLREGERTLLGNSMVLFGSSISDGNAHSPFNVPTLLAGGGGAGGRIASGRHLRAGALTPLSNLFVTLLDLMGAPVERFGDSTGRLDQILA